MTTFRQTGDVLMKTVVLFFSIMFLAMVLCTPTASKQTIAITAPAPYAKLLAGDTIAVQWVPSVSNPRLSFNYHFASSTWQPFDTVIPISSQEAKVILPTIGFSDSFQIKVEDGSGAYKAGFSAYLPEKYIFLTSPVAGQTVKVGDSVTIAWRINPAFFSSLLVELSLDSGINYHVMYSSGSFPRTTQAIMWVVGAETGFHFAYPSTGCVVQVCDYNNANYEATSGLFQVTLP
jgi:hypothetical protein